VSELDNFFPLSWYRKGEILFLKDRYDEAIQCFDKSLELDPTNVIVSGNKSDALNKLREAT
jgi:tetratricopeptide (TPR) repeat protein